MFLVLTREAICIIMQWSACCLTATTLHNCAIIDIKWDFNNRRLVSRAAALARDKIARGLALNGIVISRRAFWILWWSSCKACDDVNHSRICIHDRRISSHCVRKIRLLQSKFLWWNICAKNISRTLNSKKFSIFMRPNNDLLEFLFLNVKNNKILIPILTQTFLQ